MLKTRGDNACLAIGCHVNCDLQQICSYRHHSKSVGNKLQQVCSHRHRSKSVGDKLQQVC